MEILRFLSDFLYYAKNEEVKKKYQRLLNNKMLTKHLLEMIC